MDGRGRWLDNVFVARLWRSLKYESKTADDVGGGAAAGARTPSGVPAVEGLPDRGSGGSDLEATRSPRQPAQARLGAPPLVEIFDSR
jgi:hypothetical protein